MARTKFNVGDFVIPRSSAPRRLLKYRHICIGRIREIRRTSHGQTRYDIIWYPSLEQLHAYMVRNRYSNFNTREPSNYLEHAPENRLNDPNFLYSMVAEGLYTNIPDGAGDAASRPTADTPALRFTNGRVKYLTVYG